MLNDDNKWIIAIVVVLLLVGGWAAAAHERMRMNRMYCRAQGWQDDVVPANQDLYCIDLNGALHVIPEYQR